MVLDVMMPGMDGFETLEEIRKENSLPILMFTSKNDSISKVRAYGPERTIILQNRLIWMN